VILDACRDNPFSKNMKRTVASRAIGQGLAKVEPTSPNMLIAYSAKAGSTAADGDGKNSPFNDRAVETSDDAGARCAPRLRLRPRRCAEDHCNRQEPFVYGSLGGEDVPLGAGQSCAGAQSPGRSAPRLRVGAANRQQERAERVPRAVS